VAIAADIVAGVARRLAEHAGLEPPQWVVEARVAARIAALGCQPEKYLALIDSSRGGSELAELIEAVRVGESRLFRHRPQIDALVEVVAPALRTRGRRAIRVWSAGCAAGEEPYTLATVLARELPGWPIAIVATDVSADALAVAREASYPIDELADVPDEWRDSFVVGGERLHVRSEIAALVRFEQANLVDNMPAKAFDLVWCRNVLIYFTPAARRRAIERLVAATAPGGYVFVGYSESLRDVPELAVCRAGDAVYYERRRRPDTEDGVPRAAKTDDSGPRPSQRASGERRAVDDTGPLRRSSAERRAIDDIDARPSNDRRAVDDEPTRRASSGRRGDEVISFSGTPDVSTVTAELTARLAIPGSHVLTVDLDRADLLGDDLAPVFRRARAAARSAGGDLFLRATRTGAKRWLARHGLDEEAQ
jgi:chemotaxis methyl-accepting protein methylase